MFFWQLLSLLIGKAWGKLMHSLLPIPYPLHKSLDARMESYIVQLDFSAAFDRVSHGGLLIKLKSIGVVGSVLFISREFLSWCRESVVVDGVTSE